MSSPAVCDSKSPREMASDLNLQGNGHHSDTLTHFACIKSWHSAHAQTHPLDALIPSHAHTAFVRHCECVSVLSNTPLLPHLCYKLFSVPGAPLTVSDSFGPSCFFGLTVSVIGQLWCTASTCLEMTYCAETKGKQAARINNLREDGKNTQAEIKYMNLLCSIHPSPHLNKRLSHPSYIRVHQPLLLLDSEC